MKPRGPFPDPRELPDGESVLAVGNDLRVPTLLAAYRSGIFPWPVEPRIIPWHSPDPRGVLMFAELHVPRSLRQARKQKPYRFTFDQAFPEVIRACAEAPRPDAAGGGWIVPEMIAAYTDLHEAGHAHSVECWSGKDLVGGLYGVHSRGVFSGESMFFKEDHASKLCLLELIAALTKRDIRWMDVQMVTPVVELFGGRYIPRAQFLDMLDETHRRGLPEKLDLGRSKSSTGTDLH